MVDAKNAQVWLKLFDVSGPFELVMSDDLEEDSTSPEKDLNKGQDGHTRKQTQGTS